jgi:hypothetical protein
MHNPGLQGISEQVFLAIETRIMCAWMRHLVVSVPAAANAETKLACSLLFTTQTTPLKVRPMFVCFHFFQK